MTALGPRPAHGGAPLAETSQRRADVLHWEELLHDWLTRSEHDGGYTLLRCRVCGTETLR